MLIIAVAVAVVFWPTLENGFLVLGFDDALILDTPALRGLSWNHWWQLATEFNHAHYVPLTMMTFALDDWLWGLDPWGYHLTNVVLHALTAVAAYGVALTLLRSVRAALFCALVFAIHPVQLEAVSLAVQRKTVLSGLFFFLTVAAYQQWRRGNGRGWYLAALGSFAAAGLAKPSVITLPLLLLVCDATFGGRPRWRATLPFFGIAGAIGAATMAAHRAVGAAHLPHGGDWFGHVLMVSRVLIEYVNVCIVPLGLSPIYYYPKAAVFAWPGFLALATLPLLVGYLVIRRRRYPWPFFCAAWFVVMLLPESNLVPLAQLRADRFLYLPLFGVALAAALGMERLARLLGRTGGLVPLLAVVGIVGLGLTTRASAAIWRDDVSAWTRVVARHSWCGLAYDMLGRALYDREQYAAAIPAFRLAVARQPDLADAYLYLAKSLVAEGQLPAADEAVEQLLAVAPGDPAGVELRAALQQANRRPQ